MRSSRSQCGRSARRLPALQAGSASGAAGWIGALALSCVLLLSWGGAAVAAPSADAAQLFLQGNDHYEAGQYAQAAAAYRRCYEAGFRGADVLYNLGNAYARQEQIGLALAAYHGARRLAPRDPDLLFNIQHVASLRAEPIPPLPRGWLATIGETFVTRHTLNELTIVALCALLAAALLGVCALRRRRTSLRLAIALAAAITLTCLAWVAVYSRYSADYLHPRAFVAVASTTMRSGPGEHFEVTGTLPDGAAVTPVTDSGLWVDVKLETGKRAWVRQSDLERR